MVVILFNATSNLSQSVFNISNVEKPVVVIAGIKFADLCLILDFAYLGQAQIPQERLDDFLKAGEVLQIRGLKEGRIHFMNKFIHQTQQSQNNRSFEISSTQENCSEPAAKRPREEDDVSIQEATEIMKMLLESNAEDQEQVKTATTGGNIDVQMLANASLLPGQVQSHASVMKRACSVPIRCSAPVKPGKVIKDKQKFKCRYCNRALASQTGIKKHENECVDNPDRVIVVCNICNMDMKPSALTGHKSSKHGIKNVKGPLPQMTCFSPTAKSQIMPNTPSVAPTNTQLQDVDTTGSSPHNKNSSDEYSQVIQEIKQELKEEEAAK